MPGQHGLGCLAPRAEPVFMKAVSDPRTGKPDAVVPLETLNGLARSERRLIKNGVCVPNGFELM